MANDLKEQLSVKISCEVLEPVKNIIFWTPGLTLSALVEDLLREFTEETHRIHGTFKTRESKLKVGRRSSSSKIDQLG
jgi:hypothetical protein